MLKTSVLVTRRRPADVEAKIQNLFDVVLDKGGKLLTHTDMKEAIKPDDAASRQREARSASNWDIA